MMQLVIQKQKSLRKEKASLAQYLVSWLQLTFAMKDSVQILADMVVNGAMAWFHLMKVKWDEIKRYTPEN